MAPFYECGSTASRLEPLGVRYILGIFIIVFQNLLAKTEYAKHVGRNITFSEAASQDNNITGQTACEQVLYTGIYGAWEAGDGGGIHPHPPHPLLTSISTSRNGMRWNLVPGICLVQ